MEVCGSGQRICRSGQKGFCVGGRGQTVSGNWAGMTLKNITTHLFCLPTLQLPPFFCAFLSFFCFYIVCVLWKFSPAQSLSTCLAHSTQHCRYAYCMTERLDVPYP